MSEEPAKKTDEKLLANADLGASDDLVDIDPADFFDPEEFGIRRLRRHE